MAKKVKKGSRKISPSAAHKVTINAMITEAVEKANRRKKSPLSENDRKFHEDWGPQECIAHLRQIAEMDETRVVSRNYFRVHSDISESTWNRYFGTFSEFKRQAGITLTRQQHKLEREIAKHASGDHYRQANIDRKDYCDKYVRSKKSRFKTMLVGSDFHDVECDRFWLRVFLDTARRIDPDIICLNGDIFDLPEFSRFDVDPRDWNVSGRIMYAHEEILRPLRDAAPDAQIDLIEGNHEARLIKHLCDATPAMKAVLSDIHDMTIGSLLGLDRFEINYIANADLDTFTQRDFKKELEKNYKIYYGAVMAHHFPHAKKYGYPGWNGHHHKHQVFPMHNVTFGSYGWYQLGCGHRRHASYCDGDLWSNGFLIVQIDTQTKLSHFNYVEVGDFTCVEGKWYHRTESE